MRTQQGEAYIRTKSVLDRFYRVNQESFKSTFERSELLQYVVVGSRIGLSTSPTLRFDSLRFPRGVVTVATVIELGRAGV